MDCSGLCHGRECSNPKAPSSIQNTARHKVLFPPVHVVHPSAPGSNQERRERQLEDDSLDLKREGQVDPVTQMQLTLRIGGARYTPSSAHQCNVAPDKRLSLQQPVIASKSSRNCPLQGWTACIQVPGSILAATRAPCAITAHMIIVFPAHTVCCHLS